MPDKKIFIKDSPENPNLKTSPFDLTYTSNLTSKFGEVNCAMLKYYPPKTKLSIKPFFAFDMMPLVFPIQTNVRCHLKFFVVPLRILWKDFEDFCSQIGSNGLPTNAGGTQYVRPYIKRPTGWNAVGSLAEQVGCCNQRLVDVPITRSVVGKICKSFTDDDVYPGKLFTIPFNTHLLSSAGSLVVPIPLDTIPGDDSTIRSGRLYFLDTSNSTLSITTKKLFVSLLAYQENDESHYPRTEDSKSYKVLQTYELPYAASLEDSQAFSVGSNASSVQVSNDGVTYYRRYISFHITDESYENIVSLYHASGVQVYLCFRFYDFTDTALNKLFSSYFIDPNNQIYQVDTVKVYTKFTEETGDITSNNLLQVRHNSYGLFDSVDLALATIRDSVDTKFDSVGGAEPLVPIPAMPFRALEFIHNYFPFFRNPRIDPFIKDGQPCYNRFLTNDGSGADTTTPVEKWNALYETDYFTSCVKEPQFGNAPLVGVTVNENGNKGTLQFAAEQGDLSGDKIVDLDIGDDGVVLPLSSYEGDANSPTIARLKEIIAAGISINDLRNVGTFQRMLERLQRTSYRFANVIYEFFGTNPPIGDHFPRYIGGISRNLTVDKITNVAQSEGNVLGDFAGQGYFRYPSVNENPETIDCFLTEPSYVIALQYFSVTPTYSQFLPKHLLYKDPLDFYLDPDFAYVGPQPVYKIEVAPNQVSDENLFDVFGYNRPYAELFSNVDEVHGLYKTDMKNFLLQRFFGDAPNLNKSFIEINPEHLINIFSVVKNTDKIYGQVMFKIHGELPAPRSYEARSI